MGEAHQGGDIYDWFMLMYDRDYHSNVKQLFSNFKFFKYNEEKKSQPLKKIPHVMCMYRRDQIVNNFWV